MNDFGMPSGSVVKIQLHTLNRFLCIIVVPCITSNLNLHLKYNTDAMTFQQQLLCQVYMQDDCREVVTHSMLVPYRPVDLNLVAMSCPSMLSGAIKIHYLYVWHYFICKPPEYIRHTQPNKCSKALIGEAHCAIVHASINSCRQHSCRDTDYLHLQSGEIAYLWPLVEG